MSDTHGVPYVRYPSIHGDRIVYASEDDLWQVGTAGGEARRLTAGAGPVSRPFFSPDGRLIAYVGREEGESEAYVMPAEGGDTRRVTYGYGPVAVAGWTPDGRILFASGARQPFSRSQELFTVSPDGGMPTALPWGPALDAAFGTGGRVALGRHTTEPAYWKRYRGGTAGEIWIDAAGEGEFRRLEVEGNLARPMWIGARLFFLSDHEGVANLYSCADDGGGIRRHTDHVEHYARAASSDGRRVVYHAGGDLYLFDSADDRSRPVPLVGHTARTGRERRFVDAARYLDGYDLHPKGHSLLVTARGKAFAFGNWEGPVRGFGDPDGVRHGMARWLHDGRHLVLVSDAGGEEALEVRDAEGQDEPRRLDALDLGRIEDLAVSPVRAQAVITNHRHELWLVDLDDGGARKLDEAPADAIRGLEYAPDGRWVAYAAGINRKQREIRLCELATGDVVRVAEPVLQDHAPSFDPTGKYLYFLGERVFDPVYDGLGFDLGFPRGVRPYIVLLAKDTPSPLLPEPRAPGDEGKGERGKDSSRRDDDADSAGAEAESEGGGNGRGEGDAEGDAEPPEVRIDREGLPDRVLALPVPEGRYFQVRGVENGALLARAPIQGSAKASLWGDAGEGKATLEMYDLKDLNRETLVSGIGGFRLSLDRKTLAYRTGRRMRVLKAGKKPDDKSAPEAGRRSGWVHLGRVKVSVDPPSEWRQMLREAWRLMRDHFWTEHMSDVDWQRVYERYAPLIDRAAVRSEVSDIIWEMQGELGTSHAYEIGGDYRPAPPYPQGYLGADFAYDPAGEGYRITHIVKGDPWADKEDSPLRTPGVNVAEGDLLVGIDGVRLRADLPPERALVNRADAEVALTVDGAGGRRQVVVKTLPSETAARYREWVMRNRQHVHEASGGQLGYVHVPDMMGRGFAEFHRGFWPEALKTGLIVDVRHNSGGHVSQLLVEKLAHRRVGYMRPRRGDVVPYPMDSVLGPIVAVTDEEAGSDGDIFSHVFKLMRLGPLVGKRTWGGVVGIEFNRPLVDGTVTTQPEAAFWFSDVGWGVENYGTDPDIPVENTPADHAAGHDRQLDRAIEAALQKIAEEKPQVPRFGASPTRRLPDALPPRPEA